MKLEKMKLNLIAPYWRNPRKNDDTVDMLMQSIVEYGFNVPITSGFNAVTTFFVYKIFLSKLEKNK
jgi:ParB-like chromosome segregation protein Spo0J